MTATLAIDALSKLEKALASTTLKPPRQLADLGLSPAMREMLADRLDLDEGNMRAAAVLIPIQPTQHGPEIILTQRSEDLRHHPGQISFPGGSMETADHDLAQTALREAHEEIALNPSAVRIIGYLPDYPTITGFRVTPVVGVVEAGAIIEPDGQEVTQIHRMPFACVLEKAGFNEKTITHEGMQLPFFEIEHQELRVWGATAGMLFILNNILLKTAS